MNAMAGVIRTDVQGSVYFIQSGERPFVKIGWTIDPIVRLAALQCGNPDRLIIIGTVPGTMVDESGWHARFQDIAVSGEWFHLTPLLAEAIERRDHIAAEIWSARQPTEPVELDRVDRWIIAIREARLAARPRGSGSPVARLDEAKVAQILTDRRTVRAIAAEYGVGAMTIQNIRSGKTWRHVQAATA